MINELYTHLASELHHYLLKVARDINEADDILQETFLKALTNMAILQTLNKQKQRAWLYTTARRCLIDRRRFEKKEYVTADTILVEVNDDLTFPIVEEALSTLPENLRSIVAMRYIAGMDSFAIGKTLGISPSTVRTQLRAGLKRLKKWIQK